jgi:hypothetical protein
MKLLLALFTTIWVTAFVIIAISPLPTTARCKPVPPPRPLPLHVRTHVRMFGEGVPLDLHTVNEPTTHPVKGACLA